MKILNLYAGIGGNRKLWKGHITSIEKNPKVAAIYKKLYPEDTLLIGDAHEYLLKNFKNFDFIWCSPPCQSHSKMNLWTKMSKIPKYPDLKLYEEIILLKYYCKCPWVVENVIPYYTPLLRAKKIGKHLFWSNFSIQNMDEIPYMEDMINQNNLAGAENYKKWLGIHFDENIYLANTHSPTQILRNCVHPLIGDHIFKCAFDKPTNNKQLSLTFK